MTPRHFFLFVSPLLLLAAALGYLAAEARARPRAPSIFWADDVVTEMRSLVEDNYVDEIPESRAKELFYASCKGYLNALDDYCEFYTPDERREMEQETTGEFGGVGLHLVPEADGIRVRGARRGDPAWKAGLRAGDLIVAVDGADGTGGRADAIRSRLKGPPDTAVRVAWVPADGGARREAEVVRAAIKIDSVVGVRMADPGAGIGYLRISRFSENTPGDLRAALARLRSDGARAFVVDLRSDFGGVLPAAVGCADCFLDRGAVVVTKSRAGLEKPGHEAKPDPDDVLREPLVVLLDGNTASASEILAGALQDHRRAVLVGERTYGKFLVQRIVPLTGAGVAVRLTTARYYTPMGRNLQRDDARGVRGGLVPDVPVAMDDAARRQVARWFADQVGLDWDLMPGFGASDAPAEDAVLARALAMVRESRAVAPPPAAPAPADATGGPR
jgi:carboxyl-terminal processing protease